MKKEVQKLYHLIKCYRSEEEETFMSAEHIKIWVNQFKQKHRKFILEELHHLLLERYITEEAFKEFLKVTFIERLKEIGEISKDKKKLKKLLLKCYFIKQQPEGKSQFIALELLAEVLQQEFKINLDDCGKKKVKYVVYLDDILCTGDTVSKGLVGEKGWLKERSFKKKRTNIQFIEKNKIPIVFAFYAIHEHNYLKTLSNIKHKLAKNTAILFNDIIQLKIDNNINDSESALEFIYPKENLKTNLIKKWRKDIKAKLKITYSYDLEESFYRKKGFPPQESFFSNKGNRDKFEQIILKKSIKIYNKANSKSTRMRPLGNGKYTNLSFGFGTLLFTWRNVPFNTPLVFWYEKNWHPLFKRHWSEY